MSRRSSPQARCRGRRGEGRTSGGAMVTGGRRTERMKTGKRRRSRASRNDSVGVEVAGVTADLPVRSSRLRAAGVDGDGARTAAGRAGEAGLIPAISGVPAPTGGGGGRGDRGGAGGGVGASSGGRSHRRARRQQRAAAADRAGARVRVRSGKRGGTRRRESRGGLGLLLSTEKARHGDSGDEVRRQRWRQRARSLQCEEDGDFAKTPLPAFSFLFLIL